MARKLMLTVMAFIFVATSAGIGWAIEEGGNKRKGKYTYRKVYKACYERGEVESKTPFISPADKTQAQWAELYSSKDYSAFKCEDEWNALDDQQRLDIFTYLYSFAADSPTPAKCK